MSTPVQHLSLRQGLLQKHITELEVQILALPQVDCPMKEWFEAPGVYCRAILIRAGVTVTGARHRYPHECISIGSIAVSTDDGIKHLLGYNHFWAEANKKRVGHALTDTIWLTKHWTDRTELAGMDEWLTYPEEHQLLSMVRDRRERNKRVPLMPINVAQLIEN